MDPIQVAHQTLQAEQPYPDPGADLGRCARCTRPDALTPAHAAVSRTFTAIDSWADPSGSGLCPACAWLYSTPALRLQPYKVSRIPPALTPCSPQQLLAELSAGPLDPGSAISVPLRPGRKHLFASLAWGTVRIDDLNLTWSAADAELLAVVDELRRAGFGSRMLTERTPPWPLLRRLPATDWPHLIANWQALDPWRLQSRPHLDLATALTRKASE